MSVQYWKQPDYFRDFVAEVAEVIEERGIKKKWLCERAGIHKDVLSSMLSGRKCPSHESLDKLMKFLDLKIVMCVREIYD